MLKRFVRDKTGATVVEYALIVAVLSLAIVAGVSTAMNSLEFLFANDASRLKQAIDSAH